MVRRCCVTNCNGNYNPQNRVKTFRLPRNIEERKRWIVIIPRDNVPDTNNTVVCERHWSKNYSTVTDYGKLRPRDAPSVFDCIKPSLVPTVPMPLRKTSKSLNSVRWQEEDELAIFNSQEKIESINVLY